MKKIFFDRYSSPFAELFIYATDEKLIAVSFKQNRNKILRQLAIDHVVQKPNPVIRLAIAQLEKYFSGELTKFRIPIQMSGTKFQRDCWQALLKIPYGETTSYKLQAQAIKNATAIRAVGAANAQNPIAIIVPCHRLLGSNASLTGYSGGLRLKAKLLEPEAQNITS